MGGVGLSANVWAILVCPHCGSHLAKTDLGHGLCSACGMAGFPHLRQKQAQLFMLAPIAILKLIQRLGVALGKRFDKNAYITRNTGAFSFIATKKKT